MVRNFDIFLRELFLQLVVCGGQVLYLLVERFFGGFELVVVRFFGGLELLEVVLVVGLELGEVLLV